MKLLIVTPTLGNSPYLDETMRSIDAVRAAGISVMHVISTPESCRSELAARYPGSLVVTDAGREGGIYGAVNCGIAAAGQEAWDWFTYVNDDDCLGPGFIELLLQHAGPANQRVIAYGDTRNVNKEGESMGLQSVERSPAFFRSLMFQHVAVFTQQGMIVSRQVIEERNGFSLSFPHHADFDFWVRCMVAGVEFRYYPLEVGEFRIRPGQASGDVDKRLRERAEILEQVPGQRPGAVAKLVARLRFYLCNLPRYAERIRTVGWRRSNQMLANPHLQPSAASKP